MTDETVPLDAAGKVTLPVVNLLTGRGFMTGKSGAGKSSVTSIREVLKELYKTGLVTKETKDQAAAYALDREFLERRIEVAELEAVG